MRNWGGKEKATRLGNDEEARFFPQNAVGWTTARSTKMDKVATSQFVQFVKFVLRSEKICGCA